MVTLTALEPAGQQTTGSPVPWAKQRILETANDLFYSEGIRIVGVDRLISVSSVTKATFYKHYLSKERLILSYLTARQLADREQLTAIVEACSSAQAALRELVAVLSATITSPNFRGCAFANASAEFSDPLHPVRQMVSEHREWKTDFFTALFSELGHAHPAEAADGFMLTIDGAQVGGYTGDAVAATIALHQLTESIISGSATI